MPDEAGSHESGFEILECKNGNEQEVQAILKVCPEAAQWPAAAISQVLQANPGYNVVSTSRGEITGFISARRTADQGEILNLAVKPEHRRRGAGRALVEVIVERFRRNGVDQVFLEVRESNHSAISFYGRLGFERVGRRSAYYQGPEEAALVIAKRLSECNGGVPAPPEKDGN